MIERLELKNILSFGPDAPPIELRPLNVLIGPNGSGKSNLLDVIALLRSLPNSLTEFFRLNGPATDWIGPHSALPLPIAGIKCSVQIEGWKGDYAIEIAPFIEGTLVAFVQSEKIHEWTSRFQAAQPVCERRALTVNYYTKHGIEDVTASTSTSDYRVTDSVLSLLRDAERFSAITTLGRILRESHLYRELPYGRQHRARKAQSTEFLSGRLNEDGSNLNQVLLALRKKPVVRKAILGALSELNPAITEFNVAVQANQSLLYIEEDGHPVPASRISDGLLRMLCLMAILLDPDAKGTICLEEPEVGLHPDAILLLAKMLKEASSRCQVIVTTHSEVLVDCFSDEPESIVVCERENGSTTMRRLEPAALKKWLEEYSLAQLWSKGVLGGNRW